MEPLDVEKIRHTLARVCSGGVERSINSELSVVIWGPRVVVFHLHFNVDLANGSHLKKRQHAHRHVHKHAHTHTHGQLLFYSMPYV